MSLQDRARAGNSDATAPQFSHLRQVCELQSKKVYTTGVDSSLVEMAESSSSGINRALEVLEKCDRQANYRKWSEKIHQLILFTRRSY